MQKLEIPGEFHEIEESFILMNCVLSSNKDQYYNEVRRYTRELFPDDAKENDRYMIVITTEVGKMICEMIKTDLPDEIFEKPKYFKDIDFNENSFFKQG